jgi:hypothetical protein
MIYLYILDWVRKLECIVVYHQVYNHFHNLLEYMLHCWEQYFLGIRHNMNRCKNRDNLYNFHTQQKKSPNS